MDRTMRDAVRHILYFTLTCHRCADHLEAFPPREGRQDIIDTARARGWEFRKGEVWCEKCLAAHQEGQEK